MTDPLSKIREAALDLPADGGAAVARPADFLRRRQAVRAISRQSPRRREDGRLRPGQQPRRTGDAARGRSGYLFEARLYAELAGRSMSPPTTSIGTMSATESRKAGSLPRRGACWRLAGDERNRIATPAPPLDHVRRTDRARRPDRLRAGPVDQLEKQRWRRQADADRRAAPADPADAARQTRKTMARGWRSARSNPATRSNR